MEHHNELEKFLTVVEYILEKRLEEKPKGGITAYKGEDREAGMSYRKALEVLGDLKYFLLTYNSIEHFGICKTCGYFCAEGCSKSFGICTNPNRNIARSRHIYDNCPATKNLDSVNDFREKYGLPPIKEG